MFLMASALEMAELGLRSGWSQNRPMELSFMVQGCRLSAQLQLKAQFDWQEKEGDCLCHLAFS